MNKAIKSIAFVTAAVIGFITFIDYLQLDKNVNDWLMWASILLLVIITGYDLFTDVKKSIIIEDNKLKILKRHKLVQEIDISGKPRITKGIKATRIINNGEEFHLGYSEFDRRSAKMLKSLKTRY